MNFKTMEKSTWFNLPAQVDKTKTSAGGSAQTEITVLTEIPETLLPGQRVWVKQTQSEWIGASEDFFPTLDPGTPWPVKGYKEIISYFEVYADVMESSFVNIIKNDTFINSITIENTGSFFIQFKISNTLNFNSFWSLDSEDVDIAYGFNGFGVIGANQSDIIVSISNEEALESRGILKGKIYPPSE